MNILSQTRHISSQNIMYELSRCNKTIPTLHNAHYATNAIELTEIRLTQRDPLAPHPSACVCGVPRKYFPLFPERLIDVYC